MVWAAALLYAGGVSSPVAAGETDPVSANTSFEVQTIVDDLRSRLAIPYEVVVELVPSNARLVSVARSDDRFHLSVEDGFFATLSPEERLAAIAHELGHVWIFTNHPYLHTEQLANRIAMQVVSRESLASLYEKMWARGGTKGDLTRFLGEAPHIHAAAADGR